ncbi:hypothetical protein ACQ859_07760 [Roseateles chitinivorans]|uniref:hypothetical protein n=1 Tax=Roseateles chitinivorans TaxID=2917965 RepID=UPI003D669635
MKLLRRLIRALTNAADTKTSSRSSQDAPMTWKLMVGETQLGEFVYVSYETPWTTANFHPTQHFAQWVPYFEWCKADDAALDFEDDNDLGQERAAPSCELLALIQRANSNPPSLSERGMATPQVATIHFDDTYSSAHFRY